MDNLRIRLYDKPGRPKLYKTDQEKIEARRKSLREAQKRYYEKIRELKRNLIKKKGNKKLKTAE